MMIEILFSQSGKESRVKSSFFFMKVSINVLLMLVLHRLCHFIIKLIMTSQLILLMHIKEICFIRKEVINQNVMIISQEGKVVCKNQMKGWDFK